MLCTDGHAPVYDSDIVAREKRADADGVEAIRGCTLIHAEASVGHVEEQFLAPTIRTRCRATMSPMASVVAMQDLPRDQTTLRYAAA